MRASIFVSSILAASLVGCASTKGADSSASAAAPAEEKPAVAPVAEIPLEQKPLYLMTEAEVAEYIGRAQKEYPELPARIVHLARKNINQPYELYLLGEAPYEIFDPQPTYCIGKSDCVVFAEHTYAYALSDDWDTFYAMLQRIRYNKGEIGVLTRNHYTEADWDKNNEWLVKDVSAELAGAATKTYTQKVDRAKFFKGRYKLDVEIPVETIEVPYIPLASIADIEGGLRDGDYVNFVRGKGTDTAGLWVGHVGLVAHGEDGSVHIIHSTPPNVIEQPLREIVAKALEKTPELEAGNKTVLRGFKFLRLQDDPIANLKAIDGDDAPRVAFPAGSRLASGN